MELADTREELAGDRQQHAVPYFPMGACEIFGQPRVVSVRATSAGGLERSLWSGDSYHYHGQKKAIYVYPLVKDFRKRLCR